MNPEDVIPAYDREGPAWAATRDRRLTERPWLDQALALAPRTGGRRRVLDLGCGAGRPIAEYLLDRGCAVTGVDASRAMIELFARVVPRATALHADMRTARLGQRFDMVVAWDSFFHLSADDQRLTVPVVAAHVEPGGVFLLNTGPRAGTTVGRILHEQVFHASLDPHEYRALLDEAGFEEMGFWPEDEGAAGRTVWLVRARV